MQKNRNQLFSLIARKVIIFPAMLMSIAGCEQIEMNTAGEVKLVLNAYLYEDKPVTSIRLSEALPFASPDTLYPLISDARISILWQENEFPLLPSDSAGFYHCPDINLRIVPGEKYSIKVLYTEKILSAETKVPEKPDSMKLSSTRIEINSNLSAWEMRQEGIADIEVTWVNPDGDYFYVLVENIENEPEDIEFGFSGPMGQSNFRFLTQPFITDTYIIRVFLSVRQYGTHRVRLFRVNQEYADLYENREQDSRNLTEPLTNIKNGLGIFTAFSYVEAYFEVVKK
jgi:hypothetical protein